MYAHAYIYIHIYTKVCSYMYIYTCISMYIYMYQSNECEKSRSILSATTILTRKSIRNYLILAVSEFSISISNAAVKTSF